MLAHWIASLIHAGNFPGGASHGVQDIILAGGAVAVALLFSIGSAQAAIIVQTGVDNSGTVTSGSTTVQGCLNQNQSQLVNFTGTENLVYTGGQATLDAADGSLTTATISLVGGGTFNKLLLNIDVLNGAGNGFVTFAGLPGGTSAPFALGNGENKFIITGENFTSVSFLSTVQIADVKQVQIGVSTPTSVPEPASMALFGAGLLGLGMVRRRRNRA